LAKAYLSLNLNLNSKYKFDTAESVMETVRFRFGSVCTFWKIDPVPFDPRGFRLTI